MSTNTLPVRVGIIGCGNISPAYFTGCKLYPNLEIIACADLDLARAEATATKYNIPKACSVEALLSDPEVELVINLTIPSAHAAVNEQILDAGKHAYVEKPFGLNRAEAQAVLAKARAKGLLVGCAPDTFLGAGIQTARALIDQGAIGTPLAASAFMMCRGHESWHPNPEFYYAPGGGPMLDMGPYYLTALVNLLGPMRQVSASVRTSFPERIITSQPKSGNKISVQVPTHQSGSIEFDSGAIATVIMSFDVPAHRCPIIEIYGSEGTLSVPDPNSFEGTVSLHLLGGTEWQEKPVTHTVGIGRGTGVADMARAIRTGREFRANGALAYHVLDAMLAFEESSTTGQKITLQSLATRPAALPPGLAVGQLD